MVFHGQAKLLEAACGCRICVNLQGVHFKKGGHPFSKFMVVMTFRLEPTRMKAVCLGFVVHCCQNRVLVAPFLFRILVAPIPKSGFYSLPSYENFTGARMILAVTCCLRGSGE